MTTYDGRMFVKVEVSGEADAMGYCTASPRNISRLVATKKN